MNKGKSKIVMKTDLTTGKKHRVANLVLIDDTEPKSKENKKQKKSTKELKVKENTQIESNELSKHIIHEAIKTPKRSVRENEEITNKPMKVIKKSQDDEDVEKHRVANLILIDDTEPKSNKKQ